MYRFQERSGARVRFAGKLYARCELHGGYGLDGAPGAQDYILENGTIEGATFKPAPVPAAIRPHKPEPQPEPDPDDPPRGLPPEPEPQLDDDPPRVRRGWGFF